MLKYVENFLKIIGFKKFMWMHVLLFLIGALRIIIGLAEKIVRWDYKNVHVNELMIAIGGLTLFYVVLRAFQAIFNKRVKEDRYMYFWLGNKKNTKK